MNIYLNLTLPRTKTVMEGLCYLFNLETKAEDINSKYREDRRNHMSLMARAVNAGVPFDYVFDPEYFAPTMFAGQMNEADPRPAIDTSGLNSEQNELYMRHRYSCLTAARSAQEAGKDERMIGMKNEIWEIIRERFGDENLKPVDIFSPEPRMLYSLIRGLGSDELNIALQKCILFGFSPAVQCNNAGVTERLKADYIAQVNKLTEAAVCKDPRNAAFIRGLAEELMICFDIKQRCI